VEKSKEYFYSILSEKKSALLQLLLVAYSSNALRSFLSFFLSVIAFAGARAPLIGNMKRLRSPRDATGASPTPCG
jgi:hypothetical protein